MITYDALKICFERKNFDFGLQPFLAICKLDWKFGPGTDGTDGTCFIFN